MQITSKSARTIYAQEAKAIAFRVHYAFFATRAGLRQRSPDIVTLLSIRA